jgi:DNA-binding GntR family transcriptional regulator
MAKLISPLRAKRTRREAQSDAGAPADNSLILLSHSLHDEIYAAIRHALIVGELVPGQAFSMRALADEFGTSLIPVRDALKRLVAERGLAVLPNRTVCVPRMARERFQELLQVRLSLEPGLARRAAEMVTHDGIVTLTRANEEMLAALDAGDVRTYLGANYNFHFQLYAAARSKVMLPIVESLWMQVGPFIHALFQTRGTENARDNHAEVLKCLRRRDAIGVADAIAKDLADAADFILASAEFVTDGDITERSDYGVGDTLELGRAGGSRIGRLVPS